MKLRLPKKLTVALIAAIPAVCFTLPQTFATVYWNGGATERGYIDGDWFYTDNGKTGSTLTDDEHGQVNITAEGSIPVTAVTAGIAEVTVKDGATVRISGGNYWGRDRTFAALTIDDITAGDGTGSLLLSTQPYTAGKAPENTTATVKAVTGTLSGVQNYGVLTLGVDGSSSFDLSGTIVNNAGTVTLNGSYTFDTSDATKYTLREEGSVTWTDEAKEQGFKKTYGSSYYIIKGATVGTGFQATTTTSAIVTKEGGGNYYYTADTVTDYTKFYVKADTATLEDVNGTGEFQVDHTGATVTVQNATYRVTTSNMNLNIVINDQGVLETTHSGDSGFITGSLTINAGGIMRIVGQHDAFGWGSKNLCVASLTMKGEEGKLATLELNQTTNYSATMVTDVNMQGYSTITSTKQGGSAGFNTFGCNITASSVQNNIDVLDVRRNGVTINVAEAGELTIGKLTINGSDHSAASVVVKQGEGDLHFTGDTKAEGLNIQAGTVDISGTGELHALTIGTDGSLSITGGSTAVTGNGNVVSNTIGIGATGILHFSGTYDISGIASDSGVEYVGGVGISEGNGFKQVNGLVHVLDIEEGGQFSQEGATFNYNGAAYQLDNTGTIESSDEPDYTALYVNDDGEVSYAAAQKIAEQHEAGIASVVLNATGTTITMDAEASVALSMASAAESATMLATEDITLTRIAGPATGKTLTISAIGHTVGLQGDNDFIGNIVVDGGTVVLDSSSYRDKSLGEFNGNHARGQDAPAPDKTITINEGGAIDLNGNKADLTYVYTLNGGSLVNNGANISSGAMQTNGLVLASDSSIGGTGDFYLLGPGYDNTFVTLNNHKLTKTGTNSVGFRNTNVTEGIIEVKQGNIEFIDGDNSSLAADIVLDGGSISGTIRSAGEISITALQETTLNGLTLRTGRVDIIGMVNVSGGTLDLSSSRASTGVICVTADGELNVNSDMRMHSTAGIDFAEGGAINITNLNIIGNVDASIRTTAENQLYGTDNANFTITNAVITATADVTIGNTLVECDVETGAHAVILNSNAASVTVNAGGTINVGTTGSAREIVIEDGGAIAPYVKTDDGATTITSEGTTILTHTIDLQSGALTMRGTYNIAALEGDIEVNSYEGGVVTGNGFGFETGTVQVVNVAEDAVLNATESNFLRGGAEVTYANGVATVHGTNYSNFYVNSGTETLDKAKSMEADHGPLSLIYVVAGATLQVTDNICDSLIAADSTGTVSIDKGKTVIASNDHYFTLGGEGVYDLGRGYDSLGGVALGEDWNGTVRISGFSAGSSTHLDTLVNGSASTVEICGITGGCLPEYSGGTVRANIKLTDPDSGTPAWIWSSGGGYTITFSGDWSGDGTFRKTGNYNQSFAFSGDISEWRGAYEFSSDSGYTTNLTFKGSAAEVNAAISKPGAGILNLIVGDGQSDFDATFGNNVTASSLQVKENATATLKGETFIGTISSAGVLIIDAEGHTVSINGSSGALGNAIGLQAGSLSLAGAYDLSDLEVDGGTRYEGGPGIAEGSGFAIEAGTLHVVDIASGSLSLIGATFNYRGSQTLVDTTTGDAVLSGGTNYTALYVNNDGEASYAAAQKIAEQHEADIASVVLNATGTTITMDAEASVALSMASAAESATVLATEDITLTSIAGPATGKTLTISADGHEVALQGDNTFRGNLVVDKGTVKLDTGARKKVLGEFNGNHAKGEAAPAPDKTITINEGGAIDLNGKGDLTYVYTLNGGSLVNNGANISSGAMQTNGLVLASDSSIGGTGDFYLLGPGYDNTFVTLNNHKLTKTGTNSVGFRNTNVTEGIIEVKQGNIEFIDGDNSSLAADIVLDGGSISGTVRSAGEISITALQETTLNGLTLRTGRVDIIGMVNVSGGTLDLSSSRASTGVICVTADGELNVNSDMRMHSTAGIDFAEGGAMNIINLNIVGNVDASIRTTAENQLYGTNNAKFTIANVVITATADVTIGNTLVECDVVTDAHAVTLSNAASTYGDITVSEGGRLIASADMTISGTLKIAGSGMQASNAKVSMRSMDGSSMQIKASTDISETEMLGVGGKGVLENLSMSTSANYTIENMSISGSLIDVGKGTTLYLVNVDIKSDTHITDEAAWLDMKATKGWLDKDNTQVVREYTTEQDTALFKSGDTGRSITLAAGTEIVELTSDMFDTVTMTGTDLWLNMTGIAEATYNKDYFTLDFKNLAHFLENAQVDVDHLHVYATLDGERYTEAYSTANGGLTTTLYFQVPEPTTSTLSLLALAALAARRRRK